MTHCFNVGVAKRYGILEAILLQNFEFWIQKNKANNVNFHDGYYWTYNSISAFVEMFPYATKNKICTALNNLEKEGLIVTNNYNKSSYDRTKWYRLTDEAIAVLEAESVEKFDFPEIRNGGSENQKSKVEKSEMDCQDFRNGLPENQKPIPDSNHIASSYIKPVSNTDIYSEFEKLWEKYPRKIGKAKAFEAYKRSRKNGVEFDAVMNGIIAYVRYIKANKTDDQFIKHGSTFFNQQSWQDDWTVKGGNDGFILHRTAEEQALLDDIFGSG